jgi:hypothetical protein
MYPAFTFFSSSSDTFQSNSFDFFDEFDYGAIGYTIFTEEVDFNFETYLPAPMTVPPSSRALLVHV